MIKLVSLDVTSRCNLCCAHCYNRSGGAGKGDLSLPELLQTMEQIRALRPENVCLCGGEPLLAPGLLELLRTLRGSGISVSMVSNGLLMTLETAKALVNGGLRTIQISLDGAFAFQHDSLRGRAGSFDAACRAIRVLKEAGIAQLTTAMIPNRLNYQSMEDYFFLCRGLGVDVMRFMPFMPLGRGGDVGRKLMLDPEEMFFFQRELCIQRERYGEEIAVEWYDPVLSARYLCRRIQAGGAPYSICITSTGEVNTDIYAPVTLGSVREKPLPEMIESGLRAAREAGKFQTVLDHLHELNQLTDQPVR